MKILLHPIISCLVSLSQPITPDIILDYKECKKIEFQVETVSVWQPLIEKYFKQEGQKQLVQTQMEQEILVSCKLMILLMIGFQTN